MMDVRFSGPCLVALATCLIAVPPIASARPARRAQPLLLDAIIARTHTAGPGADRVGHRQLASGALRDGAGRPIGRFSFVCTWTLIESGGALERCSARAWTADGRLDAAGRAQSASTTHTWSVTGGTEAFAHATGTVRVRDLSARESLIAASVATRGGAVLHAGLVSRPPVNQTFRARANGLCRTAAARLGELPPFPFVDFDPLHPAAAMLPAVGRFFTGPGDPRPVLRGLETALRKLGRPPADRRDWGAALAARARALAVANEQDRAALAADVPGFVKSVHDSSAGYREVAITASEFGVDRCVL